MSMVIQDTSRTDRELEVFAAVKSVNVSALGNSPRINFFSQQLKLQEERLQNREQAIWKESQATSSSLAQQPLQQDASPTSLPQEPMQQGPASVTADQQVML